MRLAERLLSRLTEYLDVEYIGIDKDQMLVKINGTLYAYESGDRNLTPAELSRKFNAMLKFSKGKALQWLKSNANAKHVGGGNKGEVPESHDNNGDHFTHHVIAKDHSENMYGWNGTHFVKGVEHAKDYESTEEADKIIKDFKSKNPSYLSKFDYVREISYNTED